MQPNERFPGWGMRYWSDNWKSIEGGGGGLGEGGCKFAPKLTGTGILSKIIFLDQMRQILERISIFQQVAFFSMKWNKEAR